MHGSALIGLIFPLQAFPNQTSSSSSYTFVKLSSQLLSFSDFGGCLCAVNLRLSRISFSSCSRFDSIFFTVQPHLSAPNQFRLQIIGIIPLLSDRVWHIKDIR